MKKSGYSKTPLSKKLGYKPGYKVRLVNPPDYYFDLLPDLPEDIALLNDTKTKKNLIHYFSKSAEELENDIVLLREEIEQNGMIWISWPKKASKVKTDLNENIIRGLALSNSLVDVKVCSVNEIWSGLKLVIRVKDRK